MYIAKKMIVLTIGLAASSHSAQATSIFTLSSLTFGASTGETLTGTSVASSPVLVDAFDSVSNSTSTYTTVVTLAPTTTKAGSATTYEKYTATTIHTDARYTDNASFRIENSTADVARNQQVIRLTGIVTAHVATTLTYQLVGAGSYALIPDGHGRFKLPAEVALWFHTGPSSDAIADGTKDIQLLASRAIPVEYHYVESSNRLSFDMTAGQRLYVAAEIDAETSTGISNFALNFTSSVYGGDVHAPTSVNVNKMLFTSTIAPIPEPGTHAMLLAGLGIMGMLIARKKLPA